MKIKCENKDTVKLYSPEVGETIEFNDKGKARVKKSVGKKAIEVFDSITKYESMSEVKKDG